jgi:prevent-host-death family protein
MARTIRKSGVKEVPLSEIKDDLSRFLREAETQEIVITRHGKPAGQLIGFESEEDWFEYRLEHDPRFLRRIEQARNSLRVGPWDQARRHRKRIAARAHSPLGVRAKNEQVVG